MSNLNFGSKTLRSVADLYLGRLHFDVACTMLSNMSDEDPELDWCQSFASAVAALGILIAFPEKRAIELIFSKIDNLRSLPAARGCEFEFDAYKCPNEDSAIIVSNWLKSNNSELWSLAAYFLEHASVRKLQSHELLRQGVVLEEPRPKENRRRIKIYDYVTEIASSRG